MTEMYLPAAVGRPIALATRTGKGRATPGILVLLAASYAAGLCLMSTRGISISDTTVAVLDGAIVLAALIVGLRNEPRALILFLILLVANYCLQRAIAPDASIKGVRDLLAPLAFLFLGRAVTSEDVPWRIMAVLSGAVLILGAWEFLAPNSFTSIFNVKSYYVARGIADPEAVTSGNLFASSVRPFPRTLAPALGPHRVSSLFLEPVSMGNFGAIAAAWGLSQDRLRQPATFLSLFVAALAIVFADARFALGAVAAFAAARFVPASLRRAVIAVLPAVAVLVLLVAGALYPRGGDDLLSRLAVSGRAVAHLDLPAVLGIGDHSHVSSDSGYSYALSSFGLVACATLWTAFVLYPEQTRLASRYKLCLALYVTLLLCVSSQSLFSIKTAALAWFLLGAAGAVRQSHP